MKREHLDIVNLIIGKSDLIDSVNRVSPCKGDCKRLRSILSEYKEISTDMVNNCLCGISDRNLFYKEFLLEWDKIDKNCNDK